MGFCDNFKNHILDAYFGGVTYAPSGTLYVALSTGIPTDSNGGGFLEPVGAAYARSSVTNTKSNWTTASGGALENSTTITFPTATGSWGTISYFGVYDALTNGNLLGSGILSPSRAITSGDTPSFQSGSFDISLNE